MNAAALITAAGSSSRLGTGEKKEYIQINDKPVLIHVLENFGNTRLFRYFFVTVPKDGIPEAEKIIAVFKPELENAFVKEIRFVEGSTTRQESVYAGLQAMESLSPDFVLIHDGARPWISGNCIRKVLENVRIHGACVPATVPPDAIKTVGDEGFITDHLNRTETMAVQTPQGFRYPEILHAHRTAAADTFLYVDDTEIYHRYAGPVFTIPGDPQNRKITYSHDFGIEQ